jgi:hypothetical protein
MMDANGIKNMPENDKYYNIFTSRKCNQSQEILANEMRIYAQYGDLYELQY